MRRNVLTSLAGLVIVLLALAATANAQSYGHGYYSNNYGWTLRATTPAESYLRGHADVIRSQGLFNLWSAQAAVAAGEARMNDLEYRRKYLATAFEARRLNQAYREAHRRPRPSKEDLARYARAERPERLGQVELEALTGQLYWPVLLQDRAFDSYRTELDRLFDRRAVAGRMQTDDYLNARQVTEAMTDELRGRVRELSPNDYAAAKRFLRSLAYEAQQPINPSPAIAVTFP